MVMGKGPVALMRCSDAGCNLSSMIGFAKGPVDHEKIPDEVTSGGSYCSRAQGLELGQE
jgi:hypothetical protein